MLWFADPMHLFIEWFNFFTIFGIKFGPRFWDIFSISGNALMNPFFSIVISFEKAKKRFCEVLRIRCNFSLKIQFFTMFRPNFGPRFWDIFSISGNALMNDFFSIVISFEKEKKRFCEVLRIRCTFSLKIQFFKKSFGIWAQILRYFLDFRKCAYESLL